MLQQNVHGIFWNWCILQTQDTTKGIEYREEMVRTLYRLAFDVQHARDVMKCLMMERDLSIQMILSWACYQILSSSTDLECAQDQLLDLLNHPCVSVRLLTCETIQRLARGRQDIFSNELLQRFDIAILQLLNNLPRQQECIEIVMRYFVLRRKDLVPRPPLTTFLPCGGLAWKLSIEYLANIMAEPVHVDTFFIAPQPSAYDIGHLVGSWSSRVQSFYLHFLVNSSTDRKQGLYMLDALEVLNYCRKAKRELGRAVPKTLGFLENINEAASSSECRVRIWDTCWRLLEKVSPSELALYTPRIMTLLTRRLPELNFYWNKCRIKHVLSEIYHVDATVFTSTMNTYGTYMLEILPDEMIHCDMDVLVTLFSETTCNAAKNHEATIDCLKFICRMSYEERVKHKSFIDEHQNIVRQCISSDQPNAMLRLGSRRLLPLLPDELFETCIPQLNSLVSAGDTCGLLTMYNLSSARVRIFRKSILYRVFSELDIFSDGVNPSQPSVALSIMSRLPDDVLIVLVERLVYPDSVIYEDVLLPLLVDAEEFVEERLFVLKNLPPELISTQHVKDLADAFLMDERPRVCRFMMEIITMTLCERVCETYKHQALQIMTTSTDKYLAYQAQKMLLCLQMPSMVSLLKEFGMQRLCVYRACALMERMDTKSLGLFAEDIVVFCETYPDMERCLNLLGRLLWEDLWMYKDRILILLTEQMSHWNGARHILTIFSNAGVRIAHEMLMEHGYRHVLSN